MTSLRNDILENKQSTYNRIIYNEEGIIGFIDKGVQRSTQEDTLLILKHKSLKNVELMLIADGMGGLKNGSTASNIVALEVMKWFDNFDFDRYNFEYMINSFVNLIYQIDDDIRIMATCGGSTIVCAIVNLDKTFIVNIGDSRCYIYNSDSLYQITEDHNLSWKYYKNGMITKDDLRFSTENHLLTSRVGCESRLLTIDKHIIPCSEYSKILLFSDGITDILPDQIIKEKFVGNEIFNPKQIIEYIRNYREKNVSINEYLLRDEVYGQKDNVSCIIKNNGRVRI